MKAVWTLAIETLCWMELEDLNMTSALTKTTKQLGIRSKRTTALAEELMRKTIQRKNFVDKIITTALIPTKFDDLTLGLQAFLRLFTYTTKFAPNGRKSGVLLATIGRNLLGWKEMMAIEEVLGTILVLDTDSLLQNVDDTERISLKTFNPPWFTRRCIRILGRSEALKLLEKSTDIPSLFVCVNPLKAREEEIISRISKQKIQVEKVEEAPLLYRVVNNPTSIKRLKEYRQGMLFHQNLPSCIAVLAGTPKVDTLIFDVGETNVNKAIYAAVLMNDKIRIVAVDRPLNRIKALKRRLATVGVKNVSVHTTKLDKGIPVSVKADLIYISPFSSGSGAFWRTVSKWRGVNVIKQALKIQWRTLNLCAEHVKTGGFLVYSTPSILVEENEMIIERFLRWHPNFMLSPINADIGSPGLRGQREAVRLYPHIHDVDGYYIVKLFKRQ